MRRGEAVVERVRMGEILVREAPAQLAIYGLGSCVAVFIHEPGRKLAGLAHILLPAPASRGAAGPAAPTGKFADTAIPAILEAIREMGGHPASCVAKVAGGAHMFAATPSTDRETLGERNIRAALEALAHHGVEIAGMDIGGSYGRTIVADAGSGDLTITSLKREAKKI
ncbi:MAG: chemotaxis protein CheD [Acidobacteria bacterium]|nr:chemotaxis protein CheD [Acidobacteriota bacterium]